MISLDTVLRSFSNRANRFIGLRLKETGRVERRPALGFHDELLDVFFGNAHGDNRP